MNQELLNALINRIGVTEAVEVLLDEIQRASYVAGYLNATASTEWATLDATAYDEYQTWRYQDSLKNVPVEAV